MKIKEDLEKNKEDKLKILEEINNCKKNNETKEEEKAKENMKLIGVYGINKYHLDNSYNNKRRKEVELPFKEEEEKECTTCSCSIF